jgi:hypothetical protein
MTTHEKSSALTITGALLLLITIAIKHGTDNLTAQRWADDILPPIAFIVIGFGIRYSLRARKEAAAKTS